MTDETRWGPLPEAYTFRDGVQDTCCGLGLFLMGLGLWQFNSAVSIAVVGALLFWLSVRKP